MRRMTWRAIYVRPHRKEPPSGTPGVMQLSFSFPDGARMRRRFPPSTTLADALRFARAMTSFHTLPVGTS